MAAPGNILEEFKQITRYDIRNYFEELASFLDNNQPRIISYYKGETTIIHTESFNKLKSLLKETGKILELIEYNQKLLNNYKWWLFVAQIEDSQNTLETIDKSPKWLRSVASNVNFVTNPEVTLVLKQGETLEQLSRRRLSFDDWDNEWSDVAVRNNLKEEDYTPEGGVFLKVSFKNTFSPEVTSIVDTLEGDNIYGRDILKKTTFEDNDLKILQPIDTFYQAVEILINLKKEDNPEFPQQGYNEKLVVGSNVNFLNFPALIRQLTETFRTDDTITSITVLDFKRDQDAVFIEYQVEGRLGDIQKLSSTLT